jgi:hypothetical protein
MGEDTGQFPAIDAQSESDVRKKPASPGLFSGAKLRSGPAFLAILGLALALWAIIIGAGIFLWHLL